MADNKLFINFGMLAHPKITYRIMSEQAVSLSSVICKMRANRMGDPFSRSERFVGYKNRIVIIVLYSLLCLKVQLETVSAIPC
ncbi:hypothetical protein XELAEV_18003882mg [Xenopus laevis]|nr:hypothetical protein XELAEV_18003882mg [Xenopus laevis]